jgi:NAD(P)-dependent dehydrogenase (short-subunit alcohol dehydrogenase family)
MESTEFEGRVALVTGAGRGIGREIALLLARRGAKVAVLDRDEDVAATLVSELEANGRNGIALTQDLRDGDGLADAVGRAEAALGPIDILVNNAAVVLDRGFLETSRGQLRDVMAVNLEGPFLCAQIVVRSMVRRGVAGRIVNMASHSGMKGSTRRAAYAASKGALIALTRVMAVELAPHRITVNAVAPGPIESAHTRANHSRERREAWARVVPLERYGEAEEVAEAVLFLASSRASYITGHTLVVDGGFTEAGLVLR